MAEQPEPVAPKPPELAEEARAALQEKAELSFRNMAILGLLAGIYISLGGLFATVSLAGGEGLPHGMSQVVAGLVFTVGLVLVIVAGAELFTGNALMVGLLMLGSLTWRRLLLIWVIVYCANLLGSLLIAALAFGANVQAAGDGAVGRAALEIAGTKSALGFGAAFVSGILANMLVCLAVWISYSTRSTTDKVFAILLPIAAFVAAGLEHSVANMYLIPYGWLLLTLDNSAVLEAAKSSPDVQSVSLAALAGNLVPVTLGNIVGGGAVGLAYAAVYWRKL